MVFGFIQRKTEKKVEKMLPQRLKKAITDNPKKLANLIDLVNLPSTVREFVGQSQISRLGCFMRVWSYIKQNNLQVFLSLWLHFAPCYSAKDSYFLNQMFVNELLRCFT